jgi:hypothetical protein
VHWLKHWHPFLIPLILAVSRILTKARFAEYPWPVLSSDLCFFGVSFYVWALTVRMSEVKVCPPNRALTKGDGEGTYVLIFLIVNFVCSILFYPTTPCVSVAVMTAEILFAILVGIGSPIYLRARAFA